MATFQLIPEYNEAIVLTDEADTIVVPEGDASRDRVFNFDPASDRISFSRLSGVTVRDLLSSSISTQNGLLLMGSFGSINLLEVAADQLSESNLIIGGGNQPPIATDDFAITIPGTPVSIGFADNDFDPEGEIISIIDFEALTLNGGTVFLEDNNFLYTPADDFSGTDSFSYSISDGFGTGTALVRVEVTPITGPVAVDDTVTVIEDTSETIAVLANDFHSEGRAFGLRRFQRTTSNGGTVTRDNNGTRRLTDDLLVYTPAAGFVGTDRVTYSISDALGNLSTASVNVTVSSAGPVATDDRASVLTGESETIAVLENDFNPDGGAFGLRRFQRRTANGGTVRRDDNGTRRRTDDRLLYTPPTGFIGSDSFTYSISDALGNIDTAVVNVTVEDIGDNQPPFAIDDFAITDENIAVSIFVLDNDVDFDFDQIAIAGFDETTEVGGDVRISGNTLVYIPAFGFTGTDSFSYTISDDQGFTDTATVTVEVILVSHPSIRLFDDFATTTQNVPVSIFVLDNDFDPDGVALEIVAVSETTALGGEIGIEGGVLVYTPAFGFTGADSFIYTVSDGEFTASATVTVRVESAGDNEPPIAFDDFALTEENIRVNIVVLDNDVDFDNDPIAIVGFDETTAFGGAISIDGPTLVYTPAFGFTGVDSFIYTISDGEFTDAATVNVSVSEAGDNQPPIAVDDFVFTIESVPVNIFVLNNDVDFDNDSLEIIDFEATASRGGSITEVNEVLVYTPELCFVGTDSFSYSITDGELTSTATVTVAVEPPPEQPPMALDDLASTFEGIPVNIFVLDNDFDPNGDSLSIIGFSETTAEGGTIVAFDNGGSLLYTPAEGFTGTDIFSYTILENDICGGFTSTAIVTVTVDEIGDNQPPPIAFDDSAITAGGRSVNIPVLDNDFGLDDNPLQIADFETPVGGGTVTLNDNGTDDLSDDLLVYSPADGFTGTDMFAYSLGDDRGLTNTATVTVNVFPEGQSVVAFDEFIYPLFPGGITNDIFVLDNDVSLSGEAVELIEFEETGENGGTIARNDNETPDDLTDDHLVYTPPEDFFGTDNFSYSISDGSGFTDTAVVNISNVPIGVRTISAFDDTAFVRENSPTNIPVFDNDFSLDDSAEVSDFDESTPKGGTVTRDDRGTPADLTDDELTYTPAIDFVGTDTFTYSISDDLSFGSSTATVNAIVVPAGINVFAADDNAEVIKNNPTSIFVLENDFEVDGNPLEIILEIISFDETTSNGGTVSLDSFSSSGSQFLRYESDFTGTDTFTYTISNASGFTDTATVRVKVEPSPPRGGFSFAETFENGSAIVPVLERVSDLDGDSISLTNFPATTEGGGTVSRDDNGTPGDQTDDLLIYSPATGFTGVDSFSYTVADSSGLTGTGRVSVNVEPAPFGLVAVDDFAETYGVPVKLNVLDNDFEVDDDGQSLSLIEFEQETENGGTVTRLDNETTDDLTDDELVYTPAPNFFGFDSFSYSIENPDGNTDTASVGISNFSFSPPSRLASAVNDTAFAFSDTQSDIFVLNNDLPEDVQLIDFEETSEAGGSIARNDNGTPDDKSDDSLIYRSATDFTGTDSFTYSISDSLLGSIDRAVVNAIVLPAGSTVFATDDSAETVKNFGAFVSILSNDFEIDGNPLQILDFDETTPNGGTVSLGFDIILLSFLEDRTEDFLIYDPADGFTGTDTLTYRISNPEGVTDTGTVRITVSDSSSSPSANSLSVETFENGSAIVPVLERVFDRDGDRISLTDFEATTEGGGTISRSDNGTADDQTDDLLIYTPETGFIGFDNFSYTVSDPSGLTGTGRVSVSVQPAPFGFAAVNDSVQTFTGVPVKLDVLENDFEVEGDALSLIEFEQETENGGTISRFDNNTPSDLTDDFLVYAPGSEERMFFEDSFSYTIENADGMRDAAVASVRIAPQTTIFANFDNASTFANVSIEVDVLANDFEVNGESVELISFDAIASDGTIARDDNGTPSDLTDDSLIYRPAPGFTGPDRFNYTIGDGQGNTASGGVQVTVETPPEQGFAAVADFVSLGNEPASIAVLDNDLDADGDPLFITDFEETSFQGGTIARDDKGTPEDQSDDELRYTPPDGNVLSRFPQDKFSYRVANADGLTDTAIVFLDLLLSVNQPAIAADDEAEVLVNTAVNIPVLDNDFDPDFDPEDPNSRDALTIIGFDVTTANGSAVILDNDSLIYIPAPGFTGTDSFTYSILDGDYFAPGATDTAIVTISVVRELGFGL